MTTITSVNTKDYYIFSIYFITKTKAPKIITFLASILLPKLKEDSPAPNNPF